MKDDTDRVTMTPDEITIQKVLPNIVYDKKTTQLYTAICNNNKCRRVYTICTQRDNKPEYYTNLDICCDCDGRVEFTLPVN